MMVSLWITWFLLQCAYSTCIGSAKVFTALSSFDDLVLVQRHKETLGPRIVDNASKVFTLATLSTKSFGDAGDAGDIDENTSTATLPASKPSVMLQMSPDGMPSLAIVSAQYGETDKIFSLANLAQGVQGFFFTDNKDLRSIGRGWTVVQRPYHLGGDKGWRCNTHGKYSLPAWEQPHVHTLMSGKFYKLNAHLLDELKDVDIILWTDACNVNSSSHVNDLADDGLAKRADTLLGSDEFIAQRHGKRQTVTSEIPCASQRAADRVGIDRYELTNDMWRGFKVMESQGFKDGLRLLHSETFLYRAKAPAVHAAMSYWWAFIQNYTLRDQITYAWALKFNNVKVKVPCMSGCSKGESCILDILKGPLPMTCAGRCTGPCSTQYQDLGRQS